MALTHFSFAFSVLFLSLVVVASANGYGYAPKPELEIPKTIGYGPKMETWYVPKPKLEKPKTKTNGYGYGKKLELEKPKTQGKLLPSITSIQWLIYCKSGSKLVPLEGALARIACLAIDNNGYESAPFSVLSCPTDAKGYFFATVSPSKLQDGWKLTECKAFIQKSPLEICKVPIDANKGISSATLSSYHLLKNKNVKLYSVGPFFYTPEPEPKLVSKGY